MCPNDPIMSKGYFKIGIKWSWQRNVCILDIECILYRRWQCNIFVKVKLGWGRGCKTPREGEEGISMKKNGQSEGLTQALGSKRFKLESIIEKISTYSDMMTKHKIRTSFIDPVFSSRHCWPAVAWRLLVITMAEKIIESLAGRIEKYW